MASLIRFFKKQSKSEVKLAQTISELNELKETTKEIKQQQQQAEQRRERDKTDQEYEIHVLKREVTGYKHEFDSYRTVTDSRLLEQGRRLGEVEKQVGIHCEELQRLSQKDHVLKKELLECEKSENKEAAAFIKEEKQKVAQEFEDKLKDLFKDVERRRSIAFNDVSERQDAFEKKTQENLRRCSQQIEQNQVQIKELRAETDEQQHSIAKQQESFTEYRGLQNQWCYDLFMEVQDMKSPPTNRMMHSQSMYSALNQSSESPYQATPERFPNHSEKPVYENQNLTLSLCNRA